MEEIQNLHAMFAENPLFGVEFTVEEQVGELRSGSGYAYVCG